MKILSPSFGAKNSLLGDSRSKRTLLLLDDDPSICVMLQQLLFEDFNRIHMATDPAGAELIFREHTITHVISDFDLGESVPKGIDLLVSWRHRFTSIRRALIFSGCDLPSNQLPPEVDGFISKRDDFVDMLPDALCIDRRPVTV